MVGWIKLHRKILHSDMYRSLNSKQRDVMYTCLLLANHAGKEWEFGGDIYNCQPGQFVSSLQKISDFCASDVKVQSVRTALLKLEKWGFLTNESTKVNRLITICKWDTYQKSEDDTNKEPNNDPTKHQQSINKDLTTNNNVNNLKERKEVESGLSLEPKDSPEVISLTKEIASFFSVSEIRNQRQFMLIGNFVRCIDGKGDFEHLKKQFYGYSAAKQDPTYRHSIENYLGDPEKSYEDGYWNLRTWYGSQENNSTVLPNRRRINRTPQ